MDAPRERHRLHRGPRRGGVGREHRGSVHPSASTADGAALVQFTSNGGNNQRWRVVDLGGGAVRLVNKNSGKVAEVFQFSSADAAAIDQWTVNGGANQIWQMTTP